MSKDLNWAVYESGRYWALVFTVSTEIENINLMVETLMVFLNESRRSPKPR